ncbi:MAG: hypothetical protein PHP10_03390 [Candidatus Omnitrophica bacterium]|nr:hypothetical protein [Candidatus Omnitrophota bacterium]
MRKIILPFFLVFLFILASSISSIFAEEQITIATYYPSPYGSYQDLYVANELGIGTADPLYSLHIAKDAPASTTLGGAPAVLMLEQSNNTNWSDGQAAAEILFKKGGDIVGAIRSEHTRAGALQSNEDAGISFWVAPSAETPVAFQAMRLTHNGNLGIGEPLPSAKLEVVCPAGFTNVKGGPTSDQNQLGCMETAEHGTGTWYVAANTCFTTYGGRLPSYAEWYVAMNNYVLTNETGNWEWLENSDYYDGNPTCDVAGSSAITMVSNAYASSTFYYRCWIPR